MAVMGIGYWFRSVILIFSFGLVVWAMYSIRHHGLGNRATSVLTGPSAVDNAPKRISLCETRVKALKAAGGIEIYENGMSWFRKDGKSETKLDPVEVEKWFGHNCTVTAEDLRPVASKEAEAATPVLVFEFVQGAPETVKKTAAGNFIWKQSLFRSQQLEAAMKTLGEIRSAGPDGRALPSGD